MSEFPIIPITIVVVGLVLTPIVTHLLAMRKAQSEAEENRNRLVREEELIRYRSKFMRIDEERRNIINAFSELGRSNQVHWWAFSFLCRDWKEKRNPEDELVLRHRQQFQESRRDLMIAVGGLEMYLGRLAPAREGRGHASRPKYRDLLESISGGLSRIGSLREFSEELMLFLEPYFDSGAINPYTEAKYLEFRTWQQDITDDYLQAAMSFDEQVQINLSMFEKQDLGDST